MENTKSIQENEEKDTNVYIMSIEASYLYEALQNDKKNGYKTYMDKRYKRNFSSIYKGAIPDSIEIDILKELDNKLIKETIINGNTYYSTKAIINVDFNSSYKKKIVNKDGKIQKNIHGFDKMITILKVDELRKYIYKNGAIINGIKYKQYKRSSSKARGGSTLFIREDLYDSMINKSRLYLQWDNEKVDIAGLRAYESLILSGLENRICIDPKSIFIVSDVEKEFTTTASVTEIVNGKVETNIKTIKRKNKIWDGEGLLDSSIFEENGYKDKGMMLLRNHFFKCCAFNTNIKKFFDDNKQYIRDGKIIDMFNQTFDIDKIKLITTPSSLKFLKFAYRFNNRTECYNYWLNHIDETFGIVKMDHESKYNNYQQLSYQMINSLPLSKEDIKVLVKPEIDYVMQLKNNPLIFRNHIRDNKFSSARQMIMNLLLVNEDIQYTELYKNFKQDTIKMYKENLQKGKIKIANTDYCTIVGNPYELLLYTIGRYNENSEFSLLKGKEIYCNNYKDKEELVGFRNPHIAQGNVLYAKNIYKQEFKKYFNFTKNIVVTNATDNDINDRLQGQDYDSDTMILSSNSILVEAAKESKDSFTPINFINPKPVFKELNPMNMAETDKNISQNYIGEIVNLSQILQSYYWHEFYKGNNSDKEKLNKIYESISKLSSLSNIEIDKAKKEFPEVEAVNELNKIRGLTYKGKLILQKDKTTITKKIKDKDKEGNINTTMEKKEMDKLIRPLFMKYCGQGKEYAFKEFDTPMDFLQCELKKGIKQGKGTPIRSIDGVLKNFNTRDKANRKQINDIYLIIKNLNTELNKIDNKIDKEQCYENKLELYAVRNLKKDEIIEQLKKKKIKLDTMAGIIKQIFSHRENKNSTSKIGRLTLKYLYKARTEEMTNVFKERSARIEILKPIDSIIDNINFDAKKIDIWGREYIVALY